MVHLCVLDFVIPRLGSVCQWYLLGDVFFWPKVRSPNLGQVLIWDTSRQCFAVVEQYLVQVQINSLVLQATPFAELRKGLVTLQQMSCRQRTHIKQCQQIIDPNIR